MNKRPRRRSLGARGRPLLTRRGRSVRAFSDKRSRIGRLDAGADHSPKCAVISPSAALPLARV